MASSLMTRLEGFIGRNVMVCRRAFWRVLNDHSPNARAVYILGAQRSGTTMLLECLEQSMDFEVLGESSKAMVNFRIKSDDYIRSTVRSSHHRFVVFKPLAGFPPCPAVPGPVAELGRDLGVSPGRGSRELVDSQVRRPQPAGSERTRQGRGSRQVASAGIIAVGPGVRAAIRLFDDVATHGVGAVLVLAQLIVLLPGSARSQRRATAGLRRPCSGPGGVHAGSLWFPGAEFRPAMVSTVHSQSVGRSESRLSEETLAFCRPLYERLHAIQKARLADRAVGVGRATSTRLDSRRRRPH